MFCKIAKGAVESQRLYQDEHCFVVKDLHPRARQHFLLITKEHFADLNDIASKAPSVLADIIGKMPMITKIIGMQDYSLQTNNGKGAGQEIAHLHFHLLCK